MKVFKLVAGRGAGGDGGARAAHDLCLIPHPSSLILLAALVVIAGCGRKPETTANAGGPPMAGGKSGAEAPATGTAVVIAPVKRGDISKTIDVTGSLVADQDTVVGTKQAGRLSAVYVREGDPVSAGQTVAMMDTADLQAQVQAGEAAVAAAITKEQQANAALQQARNALVTARNQVTNAQTTLDWTRKTTEAAIRTAQAGLQSAKENQAVVEAGARQQERQQAQETVTSAKANYDKARADLKRYQQLFREQAVSQSQLDQAQAASDSAEAQYNSAQAALSLIQEGARPEDRRRAQLATMQAQDALTTAQANRQNIAMRQEDLRNARVAVQTAQANIVSAEAGVKAAQAGTAQARAQLRVSQEALGYAYIKSPISGYVAERRAEPGQQLGGGGAVLRIVNPATVYFQAVLPESQYQDVRQGQEVRVTVDALPDTAKRPLAGRVKDVFPVASAARSFTIRIDVPHDRRMRPQLFAKGSILVDTHHNVVLVPKDAVIFDPTTGGAHVFLAVNGKADEKPVTVGFTNPQVVEVTNNSIQPGDKLVVQGQSGLQDGDPVRVQ